MSQESMWWLNNMVLIGNTAKRSNAWHYQASLQGAESNHYEGPVPFADVTRRLFNWEAMEVPAANLIPTKKADANWFNVDECAKCSKYKKACACETFAPGKPYKIVVVPEMKGIVRSDNYAELGHHSRIYAIHDYKKWLLKTQQSVIGDSLSILSAGLLKNGAQAWVQASLPETVHDKETGLDFWPYICASTSLDGSLATSFTTQTLLIVCDNTLRAGLAQGEGAGRKYRVKHTQGSLTGQTIKDARQALSIISQTADTMLEYMHELSSIKVSPHQWIKVMDVIIPPAEAEATPRKITQTNNRRDLLDDTYKYDPMANTFKGTAFGVVQAVNTYFTHHQTVRMNRAERNAGWMVRGGFAKVDDMTLNALAEVLDKPQLASV